MSARTALTDASRAAEVTALLEESAPAAIARELERSDERDQWERVCQARERAAYERGLVRGRWEGIANAETRMAAAWHAIAYPVSRGESLTKIRVDRAVREAVAADRYRQRQWWYEYHSPHRWDYVMRRTPAGGAAS